MLVSVIVPVYKAEKWLHRCVDSILAQTMEDFELLLVDDGSPDRSGEICDEYAAKDSRVRVFHKENGGVSSARCLGFENAKGNFLMFVDSDDELPCDAMKTMLFFMNEDVNIVCGEMLYFDEVPSVVECRNVIDVKLVSAVEYRRYIFLGEGDLELCGKMYRRCSLIDFVFDIPIDICKGEDAIGSARIAFNNDKDVVFINKIVYCYRQHLESRMHTFMTTPEYEQKFYEQLWVSVPNDYEDEYIYYFIRRKLKVFDSLFCYCVDVPTWTGSIFHMKLLEEIKQYNYKEQLIPRLLLKTTNKNMRCILIFIRKVLNIIVSIKNKIFSICLVL